MKILLANKFHYRRGGCESYYFGLAELLRKKGHDVAFFSMQDARNLECEENGYFARHVEFLGAKGPAALARAAATTLYSFDARARLTRLLKACRPDVVHLHNFHRQLSCSVLDAARECGVPLVFTAHDCTAFCPQIVLRRNGRLCFDCVSGRYWNCWKNRCVKGSRSMSMLGAMEAYVFKALGSPDKMDAVIVPSEALAEQYAAAGFRRERISVLPNFVDVGRYDPMYKKSGYFLYFGRLSQEKGIGTLLDAMKRVKGVELKIAGSGPLQDWTVRQLSEAGLEGCVEFLGFRSGEELTELIRNAYCCILPSECFENCPMSVIEAMCMGKPVIGSDIGGIPELIRPGKTGFLFPAGDSRALAGCISRAAGFADEAVEMGMEARETAVRLFSAGRHYERLMGIYSRVTGPGA